jgi:hypothetical protein
MLEIIWYIFITFDPRIKIIKYIPVSYYVEFKNSSVKLHWGVLDPFNYKSYLTNKLILGFDVFTVANIMTVVFHYVATCCLVNNYKCSGGTLCCDCRGRRKREDGSGFKLHLHDTLYVIDVKGKPQINSDMKLE